MPRRSGSPTSRRPRRATVNLIPRRLGPKLNLFLLAFLVVLGIATAALMVFGFRRTQGDATHASREGLEQQGRERLSETAVQTAAIGALILTQATDAGGFGASFMATFPQLQGGVSWSTARLVPTARGELADLTPGRLSDAWVPNGVAIDPQIERDLRESAALDAVFAGMIAQSPDAVAAYFLSPQGVARYYPARDYVEVPGIALTTPQQRAIARAGPEQNPDRAPVWTEPYPDPIGDRLLLTAYTPVYTSDEYRGVIGVDLAIDRLIAQADSVEVTPSSFAFVMDSAGELLRGEAYDTVRQAQIDERNVAFRDTLRAMHEGGRGVDEVTIGGTRMLVAYAPLADLGSIAIAAPVEEVIAQSDSVASAIRREGNRTIAFTILSMAAMFIVALAAFAWINRRMILVPVNRLVLGTRDVAAGDLTREIPVTSVDELGILADSFNTMTAELRNSRMRLEAQQAQILASENELRALFNAMTDAVFVIDREGRYLRAAPTRYTDALGPLREAIGRTMHEIMPRAQADRLLEHVRRAIDTGEVQEVEQRIEMPDGGERWITATVSGLSDGTALAVARDVTSRKLAERELSEREQQYRSIFEEANDGLFITSFDGRLVDVNPAGWRMHGYQREEFLRLSPPDFIHPDDHHIFAEYMREVGAGRRFVARARDIRKDGSVFYVEVVGTQIAFGGQAHILGVVRDITERVQQERVLEERVEARTRELASLLEVSRAVSSTLEVKRLARLVLDELVKVVDYTGATLAAVQGDRLVILDSYGPFAQEVVTGPTSSVPVSVLDTPFWAGVRSGEVLLIGDVEDDSEAAQAYRETFRPFLDLPSFKVIRSWIAMPLMHRDAFIGVFTASHTEPGHFTQETENLVRVAASQVAVALENARLFEQTEQRTRELASLLEVSRNVAAELEVAPLLELILDEVNAVAPFERAAFLRMDGEEMVVVASRDIRPERAAREIGSRFPLDPGTRAWLADESARPVLVDDVTGDSPQARAYRRVVGAQNIQDRLADIRSWMAVPLRLRDRPIGMLTIARSRPGFYNERHGQLATAIASQAAVALENARLFEQTEQRSRELAALLRVANTITSTLERSRLVAVILDQLRSIIENNGSSVLMLEEDDLVVLVPGDGGAPDPLRQPVRFRIGMAPQIWDRLLAHKPVIVHDVRAEGDTYAQGFRDAAADRLETSFRHVRAWLAVPMVLRDRVIGMLALSHERPGYFTQEHASLVRALADQAAVAMDNARLFAESERRAAEMGALVNLSQAIGATLEVRPLVELILEQLRGLIPYRGASILELHGDELRIIDWQQPELEGGARPQAPVFSLRNAPETLASILRRESVVISNVRGDDALAREYRAVIGADRLSTAFRRIRSWMGAPMAAHDRVLGMLAMSSDEAGFFTPDRVRLVSLVANQAATALENARLFEETQDRTRELKALLEVSGAVASTLELRPLASVVLDQLRNIIDYNGASLLLLEDQALTIIEDRAVEGAQEVIGFSIPLSRAQPLWERLRAGKPVIIKDVRSDEPFARGYRNVLGERFQMPAFRHVRSWMAVPLTVQDRVIGMMSMSRVESDYFTDRHVTFARAIADQAAVAIENARLYEQAQQLAAIEERQRLARELHDSVSQALYGVALGSRTARTLLDRDPAKAIEPIEYVMQLAEAGLAEMRALIFELRPEPLELEGLVAGLEKQAAALRARHNIEVDAELCPEPDVPLPVKEAIQRIAQEAMHNTVKHARATRVSLRLTCDDGAIELEVRDNGRGFDPSQPYAGHLGLRSMRERASKLGGIVEMESAPGSGACIRARIPVPAQGLAPTS